MNSLKWLAQRGREFVFNGLGGIQHSDPVPQLNLLLAYQALKESGAALPQLHQVGFKAFSQTDEDGILLYILSIIGSASKRAVEFCAGNGVECNSANLIINHGWHGLLVDGDDQLVKSGVDFYNRNPHTYVYPPVFVHRWITRDNVNSLIMEHGFSGDIDLLSIDMDGVDYWIWQAIDCIEPRVVVVEYQDILGPDKSCSVPYSDSFNSSDYSSSRGMPNFCGASLLAFVKLVRSRGYRLVGCNRYGYNAFFIRNPLGEKELPEIDINQCFIHPKVLWGMKERYPLVKDLPWVDV